jgi:hypothetical protein
MNKKAEMLKAKTEERVSKYHQDIMYISREILYIISSIFGA